MRVSVVSTLIDNDTRHHSGQNMLWTHSAAPTFGQLERRVLVADKGTDNAKLHSIC